MHLPDNVIPSHQDSLASPCVITVVIAGAVCDCPVQDPAAILASRSGYEEFPSPAAQARRQASQTCDAAPLGYQLQGLEKQEQGWGRQAQEMMVDTSGEGGGDDGKGGVDGDESGTGAGGGALCISKCRISSELRFKVDFGGKARRCGQGRQLC